MEQSAWVVRISNANQYYEEWAGRYKCEKLEDYYRGFQWRGKINAYTSSNAPYSLNLVYSTIKIKLANILFRHPKYLINPRPGNSDWNQEAAIKSALLKQDTLNTIVQNPRVDFTKNLKRCALDSFFRFGVMEIGYAADWQNPNQTQPLLKSHEDPEIAEEKDRVLDQNILPVNERFYFKRIQPKRFRVSASDDMDLHNCDWVGYYDYYYEDHLKNAEGIKFPTDYQTSSYSTDYISLSYPGDEDYLKRFAGKAKVCKVWHIWDNVASKRLLLLDGTAEPLWEGSYDRLPLIDIRWDEDISGYYPIPPVFQWLSSQDEINESREQQRNYRRRFTRKYQAIKNMVEEDEKEKFVSGPDGIIIEVKQEGAISPIGAPEVGPSLPEALVIAKDDFNIISGTSSDLRGQNDRTTATQAKITATRASVRESSEQDVFKDFVSKIGRETLIQATEKMSAGLWVQYNADPQGEEMLAEMQEIQTTYRLIQAQDLKDGYDFIIDIDVDDASPQQQEVEKAHFVEFIAMMNQFPQLAMSPVLIRETAYRCGYRNEKVIAQMQKAAMLQMMGQAAQMANAQGMSMQDAMSNAGGNNAGKAQVAQMQPNTADQIDAQLTQQIQ